MDYDHQFMLWATNNPYLYLYKVKKETMTLKPLLDTGDITFN